MNRSIIFITGMSGSGKSTILEELSKRGFRTIDTDLDDFCVYTFDDKFQEFGWLWNEDKMQRLIKSHQTGILFIAGTVSNQGMYYRYFDEIIYLSTSLNNLIERVQQRTNNPYGKTKEEQKTIQSDYERFDSVIKKGASIIIDTSSPLEMIVDKIEYIAQQKIK